MGNCWNCCKEPQQTAPDSVVQNSNKEEMPEARLYPAPSHVPASTSPLETLLSNGNHLGTPTESQSASAISRFYPPSRRATTRSAPAMGIGDSKPSDTKLNTLFDHYKDEYEDIIAAEGIDQFCKDLSVPPDDFKILVLAWKLNAEQMCRFTRIEFVTGLKSIKCDSVKAIQTRLPELVQDIEENDELFKDLYRFAFKFGLDVQSGQRILPTNMAVVLWRLVFTIREPPILNRWLKFLEDHPLIRGIPKDTWNMFLNFSEHVGNDLSCYDDNEAWPSLFDDFVEYENDQANQNITKDKECEDLFIKD
ncbi:DCN1-like protein 3 [Anthonomus grandis grandis]|uniref:DCN1-like protein 3 n=1 Tax=Anthonomus grandis grandis TaxID=2921223 RepID=UPI00216596D6|nr:DCN1-like protein 3 [Anthonomus grandis grandis]XP_050299721.1 DCN1-like protein 3 [Anthonomus grandis grandis]